MTTALATTSKKSILESIGNRYSIDPAKVMSVLSATAFKQGSNEPPLSPEEFQAALIVANQYDLNPFTKEIYAMRSKGKLLTVVSVDGWCAIVNRRPELNGIEFTEQFENGKIFSVTCKIHRKDRGLPTVVTEYLSECARDTEPWKKWPVRMLRHKALIQCARVAFSVSGIVDPDEAEAMRTTPGTIIEATLTTHDGQTKSAAVAQKLKKTAKAASTVEAEAIEGHVETAPGEYVPFVAPDPLLERFEILGLTQAEQDEFRLLPGTLEEKLRLLDAKIDERDNAQ